MLRVGLTGGIGTGKSTVGRMFADLGCRVIEADAITRELFAAGQPVNRAVAAAFGPSVVAPDGSINRTVLGELVFHDPALRQNLNSLVHPGIIQRQAEFLQSVEAENPHAIAMVEAALMVEVGTYKNYDKLIVVTCSADVQRRRIKERSSLTDEQIDARLAAQMPLEEKVKYADFVIDNSGDLAGTRVQVERIYQALLKKALQDDRGALPAVFGYVHMNVTESLQSLQPDFLSDRTWNAYVAPGVRLSIVTGVFTPITTSVFQSGAVAPFVSAAYRSSYVTARGSVHYVVAEELEKAVRRFR